MFAAQGLYHANRPKPLAVIICPAAARIETVDAKQAPGLDIHEMGGVRMGNDLKTSMLNKWNAPHYRPNVFVTDGICITSTGGQNPSVTFMALMAGAVNHVAAGLKKGASQSKIVVTALCL